MFVKQISIFVQNKSGRLSEIADTMAEAGIDIRALSLADTTNYGILRLIVDKPEKAMDELKKRGLTVKLNHVIAVEVDDKPGGFSKAVRLFSDNGIGIEYLYAFVSTSAGKARAVFRVDDNEKAVSVLEKNGVKVLEESDCYTV